MHRKVQRRPIKHWTEKRVKENSSIEDFNIREAITILGGITGIIVAILWLGGRSYMTGYFTAMNIPSFQIGFSVWEYAEASWQRLIYYFFELIYMFLVYATTTFVSIYIVVSLLQRLIPKLKISDATKSVVTLALQLQIRFRKYLLFIIGLVVFYFLLLALVDINRSGQEVGRANVLNRSFAVDVYSKGELPVEGGEILPTTLATLIHYDGFRLLTYNSGKYYLFRDVDPVTCKPNQVFVIRDSDDIYIVLGEVSPVNAPCVASSITPQTVEKDIPVP